MAPTRRPKRRVVAVLIAHRTPCSDFRLASHVSHSRTECHLPLASQHTVAADVSRSCKSCPGPLHRRERAYAGSRNMKVDRIGALHNSYVCTRCLRVRHLANGFNSRRRQTSLRAPPDCRGGSVWVGSALKSIGSSRSMYLLPGNPFSQAVEAYRDSGEALCSKGMQAVTPPFNPWFQHHLPSMGHAI